LELITSQADIEKIAEEADPVRLAYTTPALAEAPRALHSGMDLTRYYALHWAGISVPLAAGFLVFGWRALLLVLAMIACVWAASTIWRRIGLRGHQLHSAHLFYMTALLGAAIPAHLFSWRLPWEIGSDGIGLLIPAAALMLVMFIWAFGGTGSTRVHPVALTALALMLLFPQLMLPRSVLEPGKLLFGDVLDAGPATGLVWGEPWTKLPTNPDYPAIYGWPASASLIGYTHGTEQSEMSSISLSDLLRERLQPLEDLIIAGQPAPVGLGSAIAIIVGGLVLLYNSVIDYRIPLLVIVSAYVALIVLPIPTSIGVNATAWHWLVMRDPHVGWEMGLTLANYELMAGPLLLVAFFMATWPSCRPMYRRGRAIYAIFLGISAAIFQLYVDVGYGAYLALVAASMLTPLIDRLMRPRALV
jgi:Na+-translocating ferredoxin:NAD+ oxidoreductase RnfD subunit